MLVYAYFSSRELCSARLIRACRLSHWRTRVTGGSRMTLLSLAEMARALPRLLVLLITLFAVSTECLDVGFYKTNCPANANVEGVIKAVVRAKYQKDKTIVPGLLRMYFHDCFVQGCDASLLLNTGSGNEERDSVPNLTIHGIDVIDAAKLEVEKVCKGVVSCADIIALATRDAVELAGGLHYDVPCGRSDGLISSKAAADAGLPGPTSSVMAATSLFGARGLSKTDMVTLLGAHTVGVSHCVFFRDRLYNGKPGGGADPNMNQTLVDRLSKICPATDTSQLEPTAPKADLDGTTPATIDNVYYKELQQNNGVLQLDQALTQDLAASQVVNSLASRDSTFFNVQFGQALVKLGNIGAPPTTLCRSVRQLCTKPKV